LGKYVFDSDNDSMEAMALDKITLDMIQKNSKGTKIDQGSCREAFNKNGRRFLLGTRSFDDRHWGARVEHRVTLSLFLEIIAEMERWGSPKVYSGLSGDGRPFIVHETADVNKFTEIHVLNLCRWYQYILATVAEGEFCADRQKLARLVAELVKVSINTAPLKRKPALWKDTYNPKWKDAAAETSFGFTSNVTVLTVGLGMENMIKEYGFGWLPDYFNFEDHKLLPNYADKFDYPPPNLLKKIKTNPSSKTFTSCFRDVTLVIERINPTLTNPEQQDIDRRKWLMHWLVMRILYQYQYDVWNTICKRDEAKTKKAAGKMKQTDGTTLQPLQPEADCSGVRNALPTEWTTPPIPIASVVEVFLPVPPSRVGKSRTYKHKHDIRDMLFHNPPAGQGWQNLPYITGLDLVRKDLSPELLPQFDDLLNLFFDGYFHIVPQHQRSSFLDRGRAIVGWIGFDAAGNQVDMSPRANNSEESVRSSSWRQRWGKVRIDEDFAWGMPAATAVLPEIAEEANGRLSQLTSEVAGKVSTYEKTKLNGERSANETTDEDPQSIPGNSDEEPNVIEQDGDPDHDAEVRSTPSGEGRKRPRADVDGLDGLDELDGDEIGEATKRRTQKKIHRTGGTGNGDPAAMDEKGVGDSGPYGAESEVEKSKRGSVLPRKRPRSHSVAIQVEVVVSEPTSDWVSVTAGTEPRMALQRD
jgi:hypothetical protein